jgi:ketosteroid isomerase-like protein
MTARELSAFSHAEKVDTAKASPAAVARHDKEEWLSLFAEDGVVEDPVGTAPHRAGGSTGRLALDRFWDTFIAPNEIEFHVTRDIVATHHVVRDVNIEIRSSTGMVLHVPTHILYELCEENGKLKVSRLAAHWELLGMVWQVLTSGWAGIKMITLQSLHMVKSQGLSGVAGYIRGFTGVFGKGKATVQRFVEAVNGKDIRQLAGLFDTRSDGIEFPVGGATFTTTEFLEENQAELSVTDLKSSGFFTTARFEADVDGAKHEGIAIFDFNPENKRIQRVRFFWDQEPDPDPDEKASADRRAQRAEDLDRGCG